MLAGSAAQTLPPPSKTGKSQGGLLAMIQKSCQGIRTSFYPESSGDTESVNNSWED